MHKMWQLLMNLYERKIITSPNQGRSDLRHDAPLQIFFSFLCPPFFSPLNNASMDG